MVGIYTAATPILMLSQMNYLLKSTLQMRPIYFHTEWTVKSTWAGIRFGNSNGIIANHSEYFVAVLFVVSFHYLHPLAIMKEVAEKILHDSHQESSTLMESERSPHWEGFIASCASQLQTRSQKWEYVRTLPDYAWPRMGRRVLCATEWQVYWFAP